MKKDSKIYSGKIQKRLKYHKEGISMKNCEMKLNGNILTITVDISKESGTSSSGKSIIFGSTEGNIAIS